MVRSFFKKIFKKLSFNPFSRRSHVKLGLYGPTNGGKSTLANRVCEDWLGEEMGSVSNVAHETREIKIKEQVNIKNKKGKELTFSLVDTPGIATKIDYEDFIRAGLKEKEAITLIKQKLSSTLTFVNFIGDFKSIETTKCILKCKNHGLISNWNNPYYPTVRTILTKEDKFKYYK